MIRIREITGEDAGRLLQLMQKLDHEAEYLLYEPGERTIDEVAMRELIRKLEPPRFGTFFVAEAIGPEQYTGRPDESTEHPDKSAEKPESAAVNPYPSAVRPDPDDVIEFAGYLEVRRLPWKRVRHRAYLVIGILKRFGGQGIGTRLMGEAEIWARRNGIQRLYLTLIAENSAAAGLYRKMGYEVEGRHPASMRLGDRYVEELTMGKWLD
jgi:ribosomal protein S18 acetylase RimI-like enzyme